VVEQDALDRIEIASPCTFSWDQMKGSAWVRRCPACDLNVYNVAEMDRKEALALIERAEGPRPCLRLLRRPDGTVITADCWARIRAARRRGLLAALVTIVLVAPMLAWSVMQGIWSLRLALLPQVQELRFALPSTGEPPPHPPRPSIQPPSFPTEATMGPPPPPNYRAARPARAAARPAARGRWRLAGAAARTGAAPR
jgi:hypothetical protein